ncbi:hypothetical protein [Pedosphaera parvula]|uniref:Uncharacterized protein n=1 Tax=Pedosphaera parvula (strain Ellin514) TaxID=320771 RepID=B9XBM1_PEDPL|nr:hypothetical protein [Pedosphaera parvula]EEF62906.1 hypothetical protein Cflav_PD5541 [Pedosphaera parvula Ellin514]
MADQSDTPYLQIRFHLADGSIQEFLQDNETAARRIFENLRPAQLFKQARIMIAGTYSMTAFIPSHISKIDLVAADLACWEFPAKLSDVVELSEAKFRELSGLDTETLEKRGQTRIPGDSFVAFLDLEMRSAKHVYLMIEGAVDLPAERFSRLQLLLSNTHLHARLPEGGLCIVNLANLVRFTVYPGPAEAPMDAWCAHHKQTPDPALV